MVILVFKSVFLKINSLITCGLNSLSLDALNFIHLTKNKLFKLNQFFFNRWTNKETKEIGNSRQPTVSRS